MLSPAVGTVTTAYTVPANTKVEVRRLTVFLPATCTGTCYVRRQDAADTTPSYFFYVQAAPAANMLYRVVDLYDVMYPTEIILAVFTGGTGTVRLGIDGIVVTPYP